MNRRDRTLLIWMGLAFVGFAVVIARAMTGSWLGLVLFILYALLWLSPVGHAYANYQSEHRRLDLERQIAKRDEEIARLSANAVDIPGTAERSDTSPR